VNLDFFLGVFKIVIIDLALAGDNALVIALAVRTLPKRQQFLGRIWGTVGAVGLPSRHPPAAGGGRDPPGLDRHQAGPAVGGGDR
jgi:Integral membrane protein TerC family